MVDNGERLRNTKTHISWLMQQFYLLCQVITAQLEKWMVDMHIYELIDEAAIYLAQHPMLAFVVIAVIISCGILVLMFIIFAVLTVVFTFAGFIVIEGTILTIGSVLLCGFILAILIILVTIAATIGVAYLGFVEVYGLLQKSPENSPLARFLHRQRLNLSSARDNHQD